MFLPILYTVLTTICAFLSLIFSGIKPIIDFGWMMTLGLIVSITVTFFLLPSLLNLLKDDELNINEIKKSRITSFLSKVSQGNSFIIFGLTIIIVAISVKGITKLEVENSFINYFDRDTEIYKGMKTIDDKLGGTTPLDVIIKFPNQNNKKKTQEDEYSECVVCKPGEYVSGTGCKKCEEGRNLWGNIEQAKYPNI